MHRPRLSIASALTGIVAFGLALAALRGRSPFWSATTNLVVLGALFTAILGLVYLRGRDRAFAAGFALFGWAFLGFSVPFVHELFPFRHGLVDCADELHRVFRGTPPERYPPSADYLNFRQVFESELNFLFAVVGGYVARFLATKAVRDDVQGDPRSDP